MQVVSLGDDRRQQVLVTAVVGANTDWQVVFIVGKDRRLHALKATDGTTVVLYRRRWRERTAPATAAWTAAASRWSPKRAPRPCKTRTAWITATRGVSATTGCSTSSGRMSQREQARRPPSGCIPRATVRTAAIRTPRIAGRRSGCRRAPRITAAQGDAAVGHATPSVPPSKWLQSKETGSTVSVTAPPRRPRTRILLSAARGLGHRPTADASVPVSSPEAYMRYSAACCSVGRRAVCKLRPWRFPYRCPRMHCSVLARWEGSSIAEACRTADIARRISARPSLSVRRAGLVMRRLEPPQRASRR